MYLFSPSPFSSYSSGRKKGGSGREEGRRRHLYPLISQANSPTERRVPLTFSLALISFPSFSFPLLGTKTRKTFLGRGGQLFCLFLIGKSERGRHANSSSYSSPQKRESKHLFSFLVTGKRGEKGVGEGGGAGEFVLTIRPTR